MLTSPPEIFHKAYELQQNKSSFVLATVISVKGSTSAKIGSKAIFDDNFKNILGWVGGGCAESFLARQAARALQEKQTRIVTVDLDDEVFGLMPCGGIMEVYLEPHFPAPFLNTFLVNNEWTKAITQFVQQLSYHYQADEKLYGPKIISFHYWQEIFVFLAKSFAKNFNFSLEPLSDKKFLHYYEKTGTELIILGQTRITEELCRMAKLLEWKTTLYAQTPQEDLYPIGVSVCELPFDFSSIQLPKNATVIVASHHQLDHEFIAHALFSNANYVGLVASQKRAQLILKDLQNKQFSTSQLQNYFSPAGLSLPTETPAQIAFSILCEILFYQGYFGDQKWI